MPEEPGVAAAAEPRIANELGVVVEEARVANEPRVVAEKPGLLMRRLLLRRSQGLLRRRSLGLLYIALGVVAEEPGVSNKLGVVAEELVVTNETQQPLLLHNHPHPAH